MDDDILKTALTRAAEDETSVRWQVATVKDCLDSQISCPLRAEEHDSPYRQQS